MNAKTIEMCVNMTQGARTLLKQAAEKQGISGRAFHRTIKVAQTIADLSGHEEIQREAMLEALQYRDRSSAA